MDDDTQHRVNARIASWLSEKWGNADLRFDLGSHNLEVVPRLTDTVRRLNSCNQVYSKGKFVAHHEEHMRIVLSVVFSFATHFRQRFFAGTYFAHSNAVRTKPRLI